MQVEEVSNTQDTFRKRIKSFLSQVKNDSIYIFLNYFNASIPCWTIRRFFYTCAGIKIGKGARIGMKTMVLKPKGIEIGDRTIINEYCYMDGRGGLAIGNDVSISVYSMLITGSHEKSSDSFAFKSGPIHIENNVWVCSRAIILENSELKYSSVIGAGSVFKGIAEEGKVYGGNPAKAYSDRKLVKAYRQDYKPYFR